MIFCIIGLAIALPSIYSAFLSIKCNTDSIIFELVRIGGGCL